MSNIMESESGTIFEMDMYISNPDYVAGYPIAKFDTTWPPCIILGKLATVWIDMKWGTTIKYPIIWHTLISCNEM